MLGFFLRLFLLTFVGMVVAVVIALEWMQASSTAESDAYDHELVRGQFHTLTEQLSPLSAAGRERHLGELAPHYGLRLTLLDPNREAASTDERARLEQNRYVARYDQSEFLVPIPANADAPRQWLKVVLPASPPSTRALLLMLLGTLVIFAVFLLAWVWPTWRDLEALKTAARKMGEGDLAARARISRHSNIRQLASQFNQMGERIGGLIQRQRELTNAVSHELRTPIARLSFELDLLSAESDAAARQVLLADMREDLHELDELISELLACARLEQHHEGVALEEVDAACWLQDAVSLVALEADARGVSCTVSACTLVVATLHPRLMTRALVNLLRNAIRYAHSRIEVTLTRDVDGFHVLSVSDDGPGIPLQSRQRVFEPFTRLDESRDRATGGFGLGLAIVSRIAQWHAGSVAVLDGPLQGATIALRWKTPD